MHAHPFPRTLASELLSDPDWLIEFERLVWAFVEIDRELSRAQHLPGYQLWMRQPHLKNTFAQLAQHLKKVQDDSNRARRDRFRVGPVKDNLIPPMSEGKILRAYMQACSIIGETRLDSPPSIAQEDASLFPTPTELDAWQFILDQLAYFDFEASRDALERDREGHDETAEQVPVAPRPEGIQPASPAPPPRGDEQAAARPPGNAAPGPAPTKPKGTRKVRRTKKSELPKTLTDLAATLRAENPRSRNVPAFLEMIDRQTRETGQPVSIHFDDIRQECHIEKDVHDETIEKDTLTPARNAIATARLPYRVHKSGCYAVVQKTV
jgi:hypothetical protein